ncbi:MAG: hypothetical protein ABIR67_10650 [Gaiellaceae bacterium]
MSAFGIIEHNRKRTREAERRADHLERERAKLERLLAVVLDVAVGGTGVDRLELLTMLEKMLEQVDQIRQLPERSIEDLAQLLRETNPDLSWRKES